MGEEPSEGNNDWFAMDYRTIMDIIDQMVAQNHDLDFIKIVKDFRLDLERTSAIVETSETKDSLQGEVEKYKKQIEELSDIIDDESDNSKTIELSKLAVELSLNKEELFATIKILRNMIVKQDHSPNEEVIKLIEKMMEKYVGDSEAAKNVYHKVKGLENLVFNYVRRTSRKGQGIQFYYIDSDGNHIASTYISGDKRGLVPNDSFSLSYHMGDKSIKSEMKAQDVKKCLENFDGFIEEYEKYLKGFSDYILIEENKRKKSY